MIKPRGAKAKQRPKRRAKKSNGERAPSMDATAPHAASEPNGSIGGDQHGEPQTVPLALAGRWIAWSADGMRIIGSGATLKDAEEAATQAGETEPIFERAAGRLRR